MAHTVIGTHNLQIFPDLDALSAAAADCFVAASESAIAARGVFQVALAGGSTPKRLYQLLAQAAYSARVDWSRVQVYFGDERAVPPTHADSNYRMAREALLMHIDIPDANVQRMEADPLHIEQNAANYADLLRTQLPCDTAGTPVFDMILLGMGADGHTCSLFPGSAILQETTRPVGTVYVQRLQSWRLSLTYPVLNAARQLLFLVAGADKAAMLKHLWLHDPQAVAVPVQAIRASGRLDWFLDAQAAAELPA